VNQEQITGRRDQLLHRLPEAREILRGSLLHRLIRHRKGCQVCANGGGHPVAVLTTGHAGRMRQISLRTEQVMHVRRCLKNYYALQTALEKICELNRQLLRAPSGVAGRNGRKK
jgi:hypothetical protein